MDSPRNVSDFTAVLDLPLLKRLFIENAKHLLDLDWLRPMAKQLDVLGIEGSNWTTQRIASLTPLEGFSVKALFMTNTRLTDRNLLAAAALPNLRYFAPSAFFPKAEFMKLKALCPAMECSWFDEKNWEKLEALVAAAKQSRPDR